jgi:hypothetical protein
MTGKVPLVTTMPTTPYHDFVNQLARLTSEGKQFPLGGFSKVPRTPPAEDAPRALIFSPHPDDECIIGALALRLQREAGFRIVNVAVTQGSNKARQVGRWQDALEQQPADFRCTTIETEFWGAMATPNLTVESSTQDLGDMMAALSFHVEEVRRNPYHLLVPAWMQDNVRRGGELVGGQGGAAPDFTFATLYRLRRWANGGFETVYAGGRNLAAGDNAGELLNW